MRIIYSYAMQIDGVPISVSLATVEFKPAGKGTRLVITEQGAFLDAFEDASSREQGTRGLLERLATFLETEPAGAWAPRRMTGMSYLDGS